MAKDIDIHLPEHELEFSFARSSGPGGQNVNKVNSKAIMHWRVYQSRAFSSEMMQRFYKKFGNHINNDGELVVTSDRFRDQARNMKDCRDKLREMLAAVAKPPKPRIATKPTTGQRAQRLGKKREQAEKKQRRKRVSYDD